MNKTSRVTLDNNQRPEVKLGTLLIDKNEDVWIIYSQYSATYDCMYFNVSCITSSHLAVNLYSDTNRNIHPERAYVNLKAKGFEVLIGSVTITQK